MVSGRLGMGPTVTEGPKSLFQGAFGPDTESAGLARQMVTEALRAWSLAELCEDVEQVTAELIANALLGGIYLVTISFEVTTNSVHLAVQDNRPGEPELKQAGDEDESGRGLMIVEALADEWGYIENEKIVWARFEA
jgi:anti-sigma regulatory factor (Ser/Thr protein kinase)